MVSEGESMAIIAGSMALGRHGAGTVVENSHLTPRHETESSLVMAWDFETSNPVPQ